MPLFLDDNSTGIDLHDIENIKKPIIGYHGAIADWFDKNLVMYIADKLSNCSIVLIGPVQTDVSDLFLQKNIHFLSPKPYNIISNYIKYFDIGIIPFKINELTLAVNPLKLYEYFSLGKSVVSVDLPEIRQFKELVYIAKNREEFVNSINIILSEKLNNAEKLKGIALKNDWKARGALIVKLFEETISHKDIEKN